jgi:hypothetical protein
MGVGTGALSDLPALDTLLGIVTETCSQAVSTEGRNTEHVSAFSDVVARYFARCR